MRKDAQENRRRLLAAGQELLAERGLAVTLNDIAHRAGVGVGTAYRRFPHKEALFEALLDEQFTTAKAVLEQALAEPDPWQGIVAYLESQLASQKHSRGMRQLVTDPSQLSRRDAEKDILAPMVNALTKRAREAGVVRPDLRGTDLIFLQTALAAVMELTRYSEPELYRRYLTIFLDGIRPGDQWTRLPVAALTTEATHTVMTGRDVPTT